MIVLDTDHISVLQHESPAADELRRRILQVTDDEVVTTVVTYEEQMRSWLSRIGHTRNVQDQVSCYERLVPDEFRDEVLARLLELNEQRHKQEQFAGKTAEAAEKKKPKKRTIKSANKATGSQAELF